MRPGNPDQPEQRSRFTRFDHMALTEEANNLGDDLLIDHQPTVDKPSDPGPWPSKHPPDERP
ncbi:hypothetical protein GJ688_06865 [Heliobacillus mobilis]|uniref:Uncharacterized protein n=1 Tax=Heliobacterium mobile TaxID=28064 RepID=A0A6I3SII0_HELMO|nr:hypothetical protein [Heliobacterium mobile]MTV48699.1 hypothetical protein [Heliobacterium mobile]